MRHLRIQILGPLQAWDVTEDGVWHPLDVQKGGWSMPGLIAAMVFVRRPGVDCESLARAFYGDYEYERDSPQVEARLRQAWRRARKVLGAHENVFSKGESYDILGRTDLDGPRRVYVDWEDVQSYRRDGKFAAALSLLGEGLPLTEPRERPGRISDLVSKVHKEFKEEIDRNLRGLKKLAPDEIPWDQIQTFSHARPDEWRPVLAEPDKPAAQDNSSPVRRTTVKAPAPLGGHSENELFEACTEGRDRMSQELAEMASEGGDVWWGSHQWFGAYAALWHRTLDTACEEIRFTYTEDVYDAACFEVPYGEKPKDAPKDKAVFISAPKQLGDNDNKQIVCGKTNWGVAHEWAKDNSDYLLSRFSVFGIRDRPVYPSILGVHTLVQTSDGFLLFALRSPEVDFHERTWSASFEESVSVGPREFTGPITGDETVLDPIYGGLYEEWGIEEDALRDSSLLAIGREWVREPNKSGGTSLNLSPTILAACRLKLTLEEVWASLNEVTQIRDREEHRAWAGCRFSSRDAVLRFVAAAKERTAQANLLKDLCEPSDDVELEMYPGSSTHLQDHGLMPTSPARLVLGSAWLEYRDQLTKR